MSKDFFASTCPRICGKWQLSNQQPSGKVAVGCTWKPVRPGCILITGIDCHRSSRQKTTSHLYPHHFFSELNNITITTKFTNLFANNPCQINSKQRNKTSYQASALRNSSRPPQDLFKIFQDTRLPCWERTTPRECCFSNICFREA